MQVKSGLSKTRKTQSLEEIFISYEVHAISVFFKVSEGIADHNALENFF